MLAQLRPMDPALLARPTACFGPTVRSAGAARSCVVNMCSTCGGTLAGGPTALSQRQDFASENPGSSGEASGKVRQRGSHHSKLAVMSRKKARRWFRSAAALQ
jgi:hypothetical protein